MLGFQPGLCTISCVKWLEPCLWAFFYMGVLLRVGSVLHLAVLGDHMVQGIELKSLYM